MLRPLAALALILSLTAQSSCGRPAGETRKAMVITPVAGLPAGFGDTDPHPWQGRTPASYPVHGTDAARFQGGVDWPRARVGGMQFVWLKATEGGDLIDPYFRENYRAAARAGIATGAYHFFYHCRPAIEQARWFIQNVPKSKGALPPVLDIEWTPFSPTCTVRNPAKHIRSEMLVFLRAVEAHYGTRPLIYVTPDFYRDNHLGRLKGYEFWLRSTAAHPSVRYPEERWTFWQYSGTGLAPGFYTEIDLNAFNGSTDDWQAWLARRQQK